jgi:hypothetical protein
MVIIAGVAALIVIGVVLALALGGGDDDKAQGAGKHQPGASAGAKGGGSAVTSPQTAKTRSASPSSSSGSASTASTSPSGSGAASPGGSGASGAGAAAGGSTLPAGFTTVSDKQFRFSMAMPKGFHKTGTAGQNSGGIFSAHGGFPRIQVDFTGSPTQNAILAWTQLEPAVRGSSSHYKLVSIKKADYKGYPTVADWQFERNQSGQRITVLDRGFRIDSKHGYSIMISCPSSGWDDKECATLRSTAFDTFKPSM